jgi:hypothetical protein
MLKRIEGVRDRGRSRGQTDRARVEKTISVEKTIREGKEQESSSFMLSREEGG